MFWLKPKKFRIEWYYKEAEAWLPINYTNCYRTVRKAAIAVAKEVSNPNSATWWRIVNTQTGHPILELRKIYAS